MKNQVFQQMFCMLKRTLVVLLGVLLLALAEAAPAHPLLFVGFALAAAFGMRLLWRSAEKDERRAAAAARRRHGSGVKTAVRAARKAA